MEQKSSIGSPKLEYAGQLPKITKQEKQFVSQLLSDTARDVVIIIPNSANLNYNNVIIFSIAFKENCSKCYKC